MIPTPTKEQPVLIIADGLICVSRGLEILDAAGRLSWMNAVDGPCLRIKASSTELIVPADGDQSMLGELLTALAACALEPVAAAGAHDAELARLGYTAVWR